MFRITIASILFILILSSCGGGEADPDADVENINEGMYFETVGADHSGITFKNEITETDSFNVLNFQNMYNGGGVAIGDINNDGLSDIYFTGNQVSDKLYLNKGDLKFQDITETAIGDLASDGWHTGVSMADVNGDGYLDIYVCRSGLETFGDKLANLLFINNKNNTFTERGAEYGVDIARSTNQAAFFDMDNDNDLDLYVANRPYMIWLAKYTDRSNFPYSDVLLENVDGKFVDISDKAGIKNDAHALGLAITDINDDGFQDVIVGNDFDAQDFYYINQGDNTFKNEVQQRTSHISYFSMGNDVADFNNDGYVDIMTVDMANTTHEASKKNMAGMNPAQFYQAVLDGKHYQYMFNTLQLNNGNGTFSEIAQLAGVSKTDWSWAPLFADFDNDGQKDLFVTNGYRRNMTDRDWHIYTDSVDFDYTDHEEILAMIPTQKDANAFFKNTGDLKFEKANVKWGQSDAINSNGAAYADLDNDGDLDLVLNNMETESIVLENKLNNDNTWLRVKIDKNYDGAKVKAIGADGRMIYQEMHLTRGFQSSVEPILHFGLGTMGIVKELRVQFTDGKAVTLLNQKSNQLIEIKYADAGYNNMPTDIEVEPFFEETNKVSHLHKELLVDDFIYEILLPHKMSQLGPFMSQGDVNGDGLEDFYVSGSFESAGRMFAQRSDGTFFHFPGPWQGEKKREELGSLMFDADGDGDLDLYVVSGSNEFNYNSELYRDQLYINDGKGGFKNESEERLPQWMGQPQVPFATSGQCVTAGDIDGDNDLDLFIGGRQIPGYYPFAPRSFLLRNDDGVFTEITMESQDLAAPGMITDAVFDDFDGDKDLDLICTGEWMPVSFFENTNGKFKNVTSRFGVANDIGWWMSISVADFNGDGKNDYMLGNAGENNKFHPSHDHPLEIYVDDFDMSGTFDIVLGEYEDGKCYPVRGRQCSSEQMPFIKQKFPTYSDFAVADLGQIYGHTNIDSAFNISARNFSSSVLISNGDDYELMRLSSYAQTGPINASLILDVNKDGNLDIVAVGNNFSVEVETIRYDGGRGCVLLGDGKGNFEAVSPQESGFLVMSDAKDMIMINDLIIVSSNSSDLKTFRWK